jgi:hypothetical protein
VLKSSLVGNWWIGVPTQATSVDPNNYFDSIKGFTHYQYNLTHSLPSSAVSYDAITNANSMCLRRMSWAKLAMEDVLDRPLISNNGLPETGIPHPRVGVANPCRTLWSQREQDPQPVRESGRLSG